MARSSLVYFLFVRMHPTLLLSGYTWRQIPCSTYLLCWLLLAVPWPGTALAQGEASSSPQVTLQAMRLAYLQTPGSDYAGCVSSYEASYTSSAGLNLTGTQLQSRLGIGRNMRWTQRNPEVRIKLITKGKMTQSGYKSYTTGDSSNRRTYYYYDLAYSGQMTCLIEHCSGALIDRQTYRATTKQTFPAETDRYQSVKQLQTAWRNARKSMPGRMEAAAVARYIRSSGQRFNYLLTFQSGQATCYLAVPAPYRSRRTQQTYAYVDYDSAASYLREACAKLSEQDTAQGRAALDAAIGLWERALAQADAGDDDRLPKRYRMWTLSNLMVAYTIRQDADPKIRSVQEAIRTRHIRARHKVRFYKMAELKVQLYRTQYHRDQCGQPDLPQCAPREASPAPPRPGQPTVLPGRKLPGQSIRPLPSTPLPLEVSYKNAERVGDHRFDVKRDSVKVEIVLETPRDNPDITLTINDLPQRGKTTRLGKKYLYATQAYLPRASNVVEVRVEVGGRLRSTRIDTVNRLSFLPHGPDYALLIANWQYEAACRGPNCRNQLHDLSNPPKEVRRIKALLETTYGYQVEILENPATQQQLNDAIDRVLNLAHQQPGSQALIYFSGHGLVDQSLGYYALARTNPRALEATASTYPNLKARITAHPLKKVLVMIDACYSGAFFGVNSFRSPDIDKTYEEVIRGFIQTKQAYQRVDPWRDIESSLQRRTRYALTACAYNETAYETHLGSEYSPFASAFIRILEEGAKQELSIDLATLRDLIKVIPAPGTTPQAGSFEGPDQTFYFEHRPDFTTEQR